LARSGSGGGGGRAILPSGCSVLVGPGVVESLSEAVNALKPGQAACIRGTLRGVVQLDAFGAPGSPIVIRSAPDQTGALVGRLLVTPSAHDVVIQGLSFEGSPVKAGPAVEILANDILFEGNVVTSHHAAVPCMYVGDASNGISHHVTIASNVIHDCGAAPRPPKPVFQGVGLGTARDTKIVNNLIFGNVDGGIEIFPDGEQTLIARNTIVGNGEGIRIEGGKGRTTQGTTVQGNLVADSLGSNLLGRFDAQPGTANVVTGNCFASSHGSKIGAPTTGVHVRNDNILVGTAGFLDAANRDFRLRGESPCSGTGVAFGGLAVGGVQAPPLPRF